MLACGFNMSGYVLSNFLFRVICHRITNNLKSNQDIYFYVSCSTCMRSVYDERVVCSKMAGKAKSMHYRKTQVTQGGDHSARQVIQGNKQYDKLHPHVTHLSC